MEDLNLMEIPIMFLSERGNKIMTIPIKISFGIWKKLKKLALKNDSTIDKEVNDILVKEFEEIKT